MSFCMNIIENIKEFYVGCLVKGGDYEYKG